MEKAESVFITDRFKAVMRAAIAIEMVSYLVSLTDSLVAGNMINRDALIAIGLMSPFHFAITFLSAMLNSGTILNYTRCIGRFEHRRANEIFSHGCMLALVLGAAFVIIVTAIKDSFLGMMRVAPETEVFVREYYDVIIWYYCFLPVYTVLDNTIMNDGGEKLSAAANIVQSVSNVLLSILFSRLWGIKGIALASVLCQAAATGIVCVWFFRKGSSVRFSVSVRVRNFAIILRDGFGRSVAYAMSAVMCWIMNAYTNHTFGTEATAVFVIVRRITDISLVFMGMALALQPFLGMLRGERNTKAERQLMREAFRIILISGAALTVLTLVCAPLFVRAFGFGPDSAGETASAAVRIAGSTLIPRAILMLFFVYYFLTDRRVPMYLITVLNDLVVPVASGILGAVVLGSQEGLWTGLAVAPVFTLLACACFVRLAYGRESFPFLIPLRDESRIFIYDFPLNTENALAMRETAGVLLASNGYPERTVRRAELVLEEALMLICEKNGNPDRKLKAECTIMLEEEGARMILRDSGVVFDITDTGANVDMFRQYIVAQIMTSVKTRQYITSAGYNRSVFLFALREEAV